MKNELKISILSIVCVLCASFALPSYGASSVRSLGGTGTYSSASSAAEAKSGGNSMGDGAINSVRAGSLRVNNVTGTTAAGATRTGATRAATTPRLSIGKYLAGSSAVSGGSSISGSHRPGNGGNGGNADVTYLEEFVGYTPSGDTLPEQLTDIVLRVDELEKDITAQLGVVTDVVFDNAVGTLTVSVAGEDTPVVYYLSDYFDGKITDALQGVLDDMVAPDGAMSVFINEVVNEALEDYQVPDNSITVNKLANGAVTADKIDAGTGNAGEMMLLMSNGDGTSSWVSVTVDAEEAN